MSSLISRSIFTILTLIIALTIIVFMAQIFMPMNPSKTFSMTMSLQIADDLNGLFSAPVGMSKEYELPDMGCSILFKDTAVNVTTADQSFESPILIPEYAVKVVQKQPLLCNPSRRIMMVLKKVSPDADGTAIIEASLSERVDE